MVTKISVRLVFCIYFSLFYCVSQHESQFFRALKPPGYRKEWHLGVRRTATKELQGFISAIPCMIRVHQKYTLTHSLTHSLTLSISGFLL
jgi:hypothetical protein